MINGLFVILYVPRWHGASGAIIKDVNMAISHWIKKNKGILLSSNFQIDEGKVPLFIFIYGQVTEIWAMCRRSIRGNHRKWQHGLILVLKLNIKKLKALHFFHAKWLRDWDMATLSFKMKYVDKQHQEQPSIMTTWTYISPEAKK